jgi:S1-C subfamily serine protease/DNA-directed RNA polymerase subunit RPC12/RpoP
MIRYACPRCRAVSESPDHRAGAKIPCPRCGQRLQVPAPPLNRTMPAPRLPTAQPRPFPQAIPLQPPNSLARQPAAPLTPPGDKAAATKALPRSLWWFLAGSGCMALCLCCGFAALLVLPLARPPVITSIDRDEDLAKTSAPGGPHGSAVITSIDRDEELAGAVGLVVCGAEVTCKDGGQFEAPLALGSCFTVSADGHLLTNRHVVEPIWEAMQEGDAVAARARRRGLLDFKPAVWVFFAKEQYRARIVDVSDDFDLAVLKVERHPVPFFGLSASDDFHRGRKGAACGFPAAANSLAGGPLMEEERFPRVLRPKPGQKIAAWFESRDFEYVRTDGTVSRVITEAKGRRWVQHTAPVNPGNSGGPLVAEDGMAFGINTGRAPEAEGIFYALTLPQMRREIEKYVPGTVWK